VAGLVFKTSGVARERRSGGSIPLLYRSFPPLDRRAGAEFMPKMPFAVRQHEWNEMRGPPPSRQDFRVPENPLLGGKSG
jgi:hypothetical protein